VESGGERRKKRRKFGWDEYEEGISYWDEGRGLMCFISLNFYAALSISKTDLSHSLDIFRHSLERWDNISIRSIAFKKRLGCSRMT